MDSLSWSHGGRVDLELGSPTPCGESWLYHLSAVWLYVRYLTSLNLSFIICKIRVIKSIHFLVVMNTMSSKGIMKGGCSWTTYHPWKGLEEHHSKCSVNVIWKNLIEFYSCSIFIHWIEVELEESIGESWFCWRLLPPDIGWNILRSRTYLLSLSNSQSSSVFHLTLTE